MLFLTVVFIPEQWLLGNVIPVYKNKGSKVDPIFLDQLPLLAVLANYLHRF